MSRPTVDHPALVLLADSLRMTQGPAAPEGIAKILGHAIEATGYELVPKTELRAAAIARVVAEHWRDAVMSSESAEERVPWRMAAHPLALVLVALDGEQAPIELGVGDGPDADRIRALATDRTGASGGTP